MREAGSLEATTETQDKVEGALLLDVIVGEGATVFELLSSEDQTLLVWWDTLLVLDLGLDVIDRVGRFNLKGDRLSRQRLDEDLHTTAETKDYKGGLDQIKARVVYSEDVPRWRVDSFWIL